MTGELPFQNELAACVTPAEYAVVKEQDFKVPAFCRRQIGEDLSTIVATCLAKTPGERFQNGAELALELDNAINFRPLKFANKGSVRNRIWKWSKRNPKLTSTTSILLACGLVVAVLAYSYLTLNSILVRQAAKAASDSRIAQLEKIKPSLAALPGFHDLSFFESAADSAENLLAENGWQSRSQLFKGQNFSELEPPQAEAELLAAAQLNFFLAEANVNMKDLVADDSWSDRALHYNEVALQMWPERLSRKALQLQNERIQILQSGGDPSRLDDDVGDVDNQMDQILLAKLQSTDPAQGEAIYRELAENNSDDFFVWLMLANTCVAQNKFEEGNAYYTLCHSLDPSSPLPLQYRGITNLRLGKLQPAINDFEAAEKITPNDVTLLLNLALAYGKRRQFNSALERYNRAIELGAHQTRVFYLRSRLKNALGDKDGAEEDLQRFIRLEPCDERSCVSRGAMKFKSDPEGAREDF